MTSSKSKLPDRVPIGKLFFPLLKIGTFTFGGGFSMLPFIEHEIVHKRSWLTKEEFLDMLASAQIIPGAIAVNTATLIGLTLAGKRGAVLACIAVVLPAFVIMSLIALGLEGFKDNPWVLALFRGVRWGVAALVLSAAWKVGKNMKTELLAWLIAFGSLALLLFTGVHGALVLLLGGALGLLFTLSGLRKTLSFKGETKEPPQQPKTNSEEISRVLEHEVREDE